HRRDGAAGAGARGARRRSRQRLPGIIRAFVRGAMTVQSGVGRAVAAALAAAVVCAWLAPARAAAQPPDRQSASARAPVAGVQERAGGEANLKLPDLSQVEFHGVNSRTLLTGGLAVCVFGL